MRIGCSMNFQGVFTDILADIVENYEMFMCESQKETEESLFATLGAISLGCGLRKPRVQWSAGMTRECMQSGSRM